MEKTAHPSILASNVSASMAQGGRRIVEGCPATPSKEGTTCSAPKVLGTPISLPSYVGGRRRDVQGRRLTCYETCAREAVPTCTSISPTFLTRSSPGLAIAAVTATTTTCKDAISSVTAKRKTACRP